MKERIQKILSARGTCSRRKAEEYIKQGLVKVNGRIAKLGSKADPETDKIEVDGKVIEDRKEMLYYVMNKPVGVETTNTEKKDEKEKKRRKEEEKKTVRDLLPDKLKGKIYPVGRLDKETSGLLLFTNDGVLAYRLTHPKFYHEKEYEVTTEKPIPDGSLRKLTVGIKILGKKTKPASIKKLSGRIFSISLTEGRNRQIRRMCKKVGYPVKKLRRVRIVTLLDDKLDEGKLRKLSKEEAQNLISAVGLAN
jgi:pseudouridine synthase